MKILFVCNEYPTAITGGIGTFTRGLGEALAVRGHEIHVVGRAASAVLLRQMLLDDVFSMLPTAMGQRASLWLSIREK